MMDNHTPKESTCHKFIKWAKMHRPVSACTIQVGWRNPHDMDMGRL